MYFSKEFLLDLYKKLSSLYSGNDIEAQGGTQFVSELKYFLATDYFKKQKGKACDTNLKDDKDFFVSSVGKIVLLAGDGSFLATKNFANSIGEARDFDVGSNFFSANAVAKSKISTEPQKFPNRHPQLLSITKGVVDTYTGGYENFANDEEYFGRNLKKFAILFLWLNRFSNFSSKDSVYTDSLFNLKKNFSSELISVLQWESSEVKTEVEKLITNVQLVENKAYLEKDDFVAMQKLPTSLNENANQYIKIPLVYSKQTNTDILKNELINLFSEVIKTREDKDYKFSARQIIFGIQHGKDIDNLLSQNLSTYKEIVTGAGASDTNPINYGTQIYRMFKDFIETDIRDENAQAEESSKPTLFTSPEQIIFYGVPGSGKSHEIKHKLETEFEIPEQQQDLFVERTVFHPEYTNADFIGQIMPKLVQGKTDFVFKPGPFTSVLKKALCDSQHRYVLIIEEINRGNASAIFGELFQLLDRIEDENKKTSHEKEFNTYGKGWSEYFVMNSEINNYIRDSDDTFDGKALDINGIHFSANTGIRLPPNLSILATMNTSDQNVFTLDNAFQRRWDMKLIENVFGDTEEETNQRNAFVDSAKQITWEKFQTAINIKIGKMSEDAGLSSMEDKRLGCWFVKAVKQGNDYIISKDLFAEKVLKYLWDDAFKFCREKVFNGYTNLESLTRDFKGDKEFSVFKDLFSETKN